MTEAEKRVLVEKVMGWFIYEMLDPKQDYTLSAKTISEIRYWNPHTDPRQFLELLKAFDNNPKWESKFSDILSEKYRGYLENLSGLGIMVWMFENADKICKAIIEAVTQEEA